jgi:hypothetical protein
MTTQEIAKREAARVQDQEAREHRAFIAWMRARAQAQAVTNPGMAAALLDGAIRLAAIEACKGKAQGKE